MSLNSSSWVKFGTSWTLGVCLITAQFGVARGQDLNGTHAVSKDEPNTVDYDLNELARTEQQARRAHKMKNAGLIVAGSSYAWALSC